MVLIAKKGFLVLVLLFSYNIIFSQKDTLKHNEPIRATANIQVTNNGLSLFPNLMLGKPATIINVAVGKNHIFFEPELRWRLNGDPWSYIFWFRYRPQRTAHFSWHVGAHPSYVIRANQVVVNGKEEKRWVAQRYLAGEVVPVWHYSPKFSLGFHVLYSKGLDIYATQKSVYTSLQPRFPQITISKDYYLGFFPQIFHLVLDSKEGTYYSQMVSFNKNNLPLYITTVFTYKIKSTIAGDNIVWNIGLNAKF